MKIGLQGFAAAGALALCALVSGPAAAQSSFNNNREVAEFSAESLGAILTQMGIKYTVESGGTGEPYLLFDYKNLKMFLLPTACSSGPKKKCVGALMTAYWEPYKGVSRAEMMERVNAFDMNYDYADAGLDQKNAPTLSRYLISDYGMKSGNIRVEIEVFGDMAIKFAQEIDKPYAPEQPGPQQLQ